VLIRGLIISVNDNFNKRHNLWIRTKDKKNALLRARRDVSELLEVWHPKLWNGRVPNIDFNDVVFEDEIESPFDLFGRERLASVRVHVFQSNTQSIKIERTGER